MSLTSLTFLSLFALSLVLYILVPRQLRWPLLLLFSIGFLLLSSPPVCLPLFLFTAVSAWGCGEKIRKARAADAEKAVQGWLAAGLGLILGLLALVKYTGFLTENLNALFHLTLKAPLIPAPLGISFYSLQAAGYLLDCAWGISEGESSLFRVGLFLGYWPALTCGPVSRHRELRGSLYAGASPQFSDVTEGLFRMSWGLFKKLVLSARLALLTDQIYGDTERFGGGYIWLAAAAFTLQLYTDFSGCMDMILGASRCYGIRLPENFRTPFFAQSVQEFWQRWHMTLGSFLKDYVLYPVLRSRTWRNMGKWSKKHLGKKAARQLPSFLGMLCVWLLIGLWHGGNWKFILGMGLWFWGCIVFEQLTESGRAALWKGLGLSPDGRLRRILRSFFVFAAVCIGNMFFRLNSLAEVFKCMQSGFRAGAPQFSAELFPGLKTADLILLAAGLVLLLAISLLQEKRAEGFWCVPNKPVCNWLLIGALALAVLVFGCYGPGFDAAAFIYQRF